MENTLFNAICTDLYQQGYSICDNFMPAHQWQALSSEALLRQQQGDFVAAGTGPQANQHALRGDAISWLENSDNNPHVQHYLHSMQALQASINAQLLLNLQAFETHFAIYPAGAGYAKHLDQFGAGADDTRQVSSILYLNENWQSADGGQLKLDLADQTLEIAPIGGRLVLFLSGEFWHEVLPARRTRTSLTGWFRRRDQSVI